MNRIHSTVIFLLLTLPVQAASVTPYTSFRHYRSSDGLPGNFVTNIMQSSSGYIWLVASSSLCRFDGMHFKTYFPEATPQYPSNAVSCVVELPDSSLLVGSETGAFLFDTATERFNRFECTTVDSVSLNTPVNSIVIDDRGHYWFGTARQGIFRFDPSTFSLDRYTGGQDPEGGPFGQVRRLYQDSRGDLWAGTINRGVFRMKAGTDRFIRYSPQDGPGAIGDHYIEAIFEDSFGNLWFGSFNNGLSRFDRDSETFSHYFTRNDPMPITHVHDLNEYRSGELLITSDNGLTLLDVNTLEYTTLLPEPDNPKFSIGNKFVYATCVDREGGLWIGSYYGGVSYCAPRFSFFESFRPQSGREALHGHIVSCFAEDEQGRIWIGSDDGGLSCFDARRGTFDPGPFRYRELPFADQNIHALLVDRQRLWVGTYATGLYVYDQADRSTRQWLVSSAAGSIAGNSVYALEKSMDGRIWVGTTTGLCWYDPAQDRFTAVEELDSTAVNQIIADPRGMLWVSTYGRGLFILNLRSGKWTNYLPAQDAGDNTSNLLSDRIANLCLDAECTLWIIAGGLSSFSPESGLFTHYPDIGRHRAGLMTVLPGENRMLWVSSDKGIIRFDPATGESKLYGESDGLVSELFCGNAGLRSAEGRLYFGSTSGFARFRPSQAQDNPFVPEVRITAFQLENRTVTAGAPDGTLDRPVERTGRIVLQNRQPLVGFEFAALSYVNPDRNLYAYKLEGLDKEWIVTHEPKATYTNLLPGRYTFLVRAANNDEVWNERPARVELVIHPPLLLSRGAYVIYTVLFLALLLWMVT